jgi:hypothetical protein
MATRNRKSGYVALFDVLGFSDRVVRNGLDGLDRYIETVIQVGEPFTQQRGTILFPDTVVVYTFDDSPNSFHDILTVSSRLLYAFIVSDVPVRGAISHGDFVRSEHDEHGTVIAGRPIIEAHHYEAQMQCIGVMLAPSVLEHVDDLPNRCYLAKAKEKPAGSQSRFAAALNALMIQPWPSIPLEAVRGETTLYDGYVVVPIEMVDCLDGIRNSLNGVGHKLQRMKQLAPEARSQSKYQRTIEWLNVVKVTLAEAGLAH